MEIKRKLMTLGGQSTTIKNAVNATFQKTENLLKVFSSQPSHLEETYSTLVRQPSLQEFEAILKLLGLKKQEYPQLWEMALIKKRPK
jgi:hypothetical protein